MTDPAVPGTVAVTQAPPGMGDWDLRGLCRDHPQLLEATSTAGVKLARALCARCPVWRPCRAWGLGLGTYAHPDPGGMIGGLTELERRAVRRAMGRTGAEAEPQEAVPAPIDLKECTRCGEFKALDEFYRNKTTRDGRASACKKCEYKAKQQYRRQR
ncbi:WhiB family transcriptional regulator [Actinomadura rupiterrae]|uniref:WhiB family transcriptional regulator n=1 Tax=Actinomadura rupiterrae TaxID=559627 RepID=UPI0020A593FA|nr:WhiB family transcriptional regulator [Actinomadura rupiterrae]MCP2339206.1 hypothetical protein [Actinomadura rupiterrae]